MQKDQDTENENGVNLLPHFATPFTEITPTPERTGDYFMSNINIDRTPTAMLRAYMETDEGIALIEQAAGGVEYAEDARGSTDWINRLISERATAPDAESQILYEVSDLADWLEGAATDLRSWIEGYLKITGALAATVVALDDFAADQNEANRQKLLSASEKHAGYRIVMEEKNRRKIRPFVTLKSKRSSINFGSLNYIVDNYVEAKKAVA